MELRNLPEQVAKNQEDIKQLKSGIRPKYAIDFSDLSTIITEENVGEYAIVNQDGVNKLYIIARRANDELIAKDLGQYPAVVKGEKGDTGSNGADGEVGSTIFGASVNPPTGARIGDFYIQKKIVDGAIDYILNKLDINGIWIPQFSMRGPQGLPGVSENVIIPNPEGLPTDVLKTIDVNGSVFEIVGKAEIDVDDISELIEGSDTVVVDLNESEDKLQIRLDQDVIDEIDSKLDASKAAVSAVGGLVIPDAAPVNHKLVGIDNTNGQELIGIGDGLTIELGNLKVTSGGGGSYVEKTNTPNVLYGTNHLGETVSNYTVDTGSSFGSIPMRNLDNDIEVPLVPNSNKAASSKSYVDNKVKNSTIALVGSDGATIGSFTLNQSSNKTITIPSGGGTANELMYSHTLYLKKNNGDEFIILRFNHSGDTQLYESIADFLSDTASTNIAANTGYTPSESQLHKIKPVIWVGGDNISKRGYTSEGDLITVDATWDVIAEDVFQIQNRGE